MWCLLRANYQPLPINFGGDVIELQRGQFLTGRFSASGELNMNSSTVYKILKKLELWGMISLKSNNKNTVITIVNYSSYQDVAFSEEQQDNNKVTTGEQQSNNKVTQIKNIRSKELKETNNSSNEKNFNLSDIHEEMLEYWGRDWKMIPNHVKNEVVSLREKFGDVKFFDAVKQSSERGATNIAYVKVILGEKLSAKEQEAHKQREAMLNWKPPEER